MDIVTLSKALADETRARIAGVLLDHELNVGELQQVLDMGQSRVSRHLRILATAGLVECRRDGLWAYYKAADDGPARAFLDAAVPYLEGDPQVTADQARAARAVEERKQATRRFFDAVAAQWDDLIRDVLGGLDLAGEVLARMPECRTAADLGCGSGRMLATLGERAGTVIGVDNSARMLEQAGKRLPEGVKASLRIGDLTHLPLKDWEADFALLSMALHHVSQPQDVLAEAARVLKSGGTLLIADFDKHEQESMREEYGDHWLGFDAGSLRSWLERNRFEVQEVAERPVNRGLTVLLVEARKK